MGDKNGKPETETVQMSEVDMLRAQLAAERAAHARTAVERAEAIAALRQVEQGVQLDQLGLKYGVKPGDQANIETTGKLVITRTRPEVDKVS